MATSAKDWKKKEEGHELEVPSGNTCLVRRPGPQAFLSGGSIPNSLLAHIMPLLEDAQEKGAQGDKAPIPEAAFADLQKQIMDDPAKLQDMFMMVDNIAVQCVIEPVLSPVPLWTVEDQAAGRCTLEAVGREAQSKKDAELLYVDQVDFEDKVFIFAFAVGGTADLERFRTGTEALVAAGQDGSAVPDAPQ
jgi:hypothetical protein